MIGQLWPLKAKILVGLTSNKTQSTNSVINDNESII